MIKLKDIIKEARFINPDKNDTSILKKYGLDQVETLLQSDDETTRKMASDHLIKAYKHSIHPDTEYMRVDLDPVEVAEYQDSLLGLIHKYAPDYIAEIRLTSDKAGDNINKLKSIVKNQSYAMGVYDDPAEPVHFEIWEDKAKAAEFAELLKSLNLKFTQETENDGGYIIYMFDVDKAQIESLIDMQIPYNLSESIAEIRLSSDKSIFTLGDLTEEQFKEIRDDVDPYYFSSGQEGSLWGFMYSMVLNKLNNRQIANILNKQYSIGDEIDTHEEGMYATDKIMDKFNNFKYIVNLLDLEDIQLSQNRGSVTEIRLKSGGIEKQDKIVSYEDTGGPHEFFRYWKNDEHDSHVLYYTMSDESTWDNDTEERFEVYKAYPSTFTMIATDLDEKDATHLAYKLAMEDPNGKFVKWNMSYSRFDLPI